ncbi:hypothetical protein TGAM01_v206586 [Trichoderma gamsii]|uniref:Uncharacterized protein n=1 Tax=Trichoderma gamsii TaxID=398673 RepID=A0A2P4ZK46_9HYPO|nr:hypothetical protein TGAM01_v206586 [Trichoderma gamsii]PON24656.1 hypothetical protein TGAM01_v206586 [Trichoderma gamsii]
MLHPALERMHLYEATLYLCHDFRTSTPTVMQSYAFFA